MLDLRDVLELVIDGFHDSAFAEQEHVVVMQQATLHVGAGEGDELHLAGLQQLRHELLTDVAFVAKELAEEASGKGGHRLSVVAIARR